MSFFGKIIKKFISIFSSEEDNKVDQPTKDLPKEKNSKDPTTIILEEIKKIESQKRQYQSPNNLTVEHEKDEVDQDVEIEKEKIQRHNLSSFRSKVGVQTKTETLVRRHKRRREKYIGAIIKEFQNRIKMAESSQDFEYAIKIYNELLYKIGRIEFNKLIEELEALKKKKEQNHQDLKGQLLALQQDRKSDPLELIDRIDRFFRTFKYFDKTVERNVEELRARQKKLHDQRAVYLNQERSLVSSIKSNKFKRGYLLLTELNNHPFNNPVGHYSNDLNKHQDDLVQKEHKFIAKEIIRIKNRHSSDLNAIRSQLLELKSLVYTTTSISNELKNVQAKIDSKRREEAEILRKTKELLSEIKVLIGKGNYDAVLGRIQKDTLIYRKCMSHQLILEVDRIKTRARDAIEENKKKREAFLFKFEEIKEFNDVKRTTDDVLRSTLDRIKELEKSDFYEEFKIDISKEQDIYQTKKREFNRQKFEKTKNKIAVLEKKGEFEKAVELARSSVSQFEAKGRKDHFYLEVDRLNKKVDLKKFKHTIEVLREKIGSRIFYQARNFGSFLSEIKNIKASSSKYPKAEISDILFELDRIEAEIKKDHKASLINTFNSDLNSGDLESANQRLTEIRNSGYFDGWAIKSYNGKINEASSRFRPFPELLYLGLYMPSSHKEEYYLNQFEYHNFNKRLYDFKDGRNQLLFTQQVIKKIKDNVPYDSNTVFCVCPASTMSKNIKRFQSFCVTVSRDLNIQNGYTYILPKFDRDEEKGNKFKDIKESIKFNESALRGRDLIVFDDVTTHGNTFYQIKEELNRIGVKRVCFVFIGITHNAHMYRKYYNR